MPTRFNYGLEQESELQMDHPLQNFALLASQLCESPIAAIISKSVEPIDVLATVGVSIDVLRHGMQQCPASQAVRLLDASPIHSFQVLPFPIAEPNARFYAAIPLHDSNSRVVGAVMLMDASERSLAPNQRQALQTLGWLLTAHFEIEQRARELQRIDAEHERKAAFLRHALGPSGWGASSRDVICTVDQEGRFRDVSESAKVVWGYGPHEVVGRKYIEFVHPEDRERTMHAVEELDSSQRFLDFQNRYVRKDGSVVYLSWSAAWVEQEKLFYCIARDETERRNVDEHLREQQSRSTELLDSIPHVLWIASPAGTIEYVNERATEFTGKPKEELLREGWLDTLHPDDVARTVEFWNNCLVSGQPCSTEYRMRRADGVYTWVLAQARPIKDKSGNVVKWAGASSIIDEQKRFEAQLKEQAMLLEMARDAVVVNQADGIISYWNKGAEEIYGYSKAEAIGRKFQDLVGRSDAHANALAIVRSEGKWKGELQHKRKDGREITVSCSWTCPFEPDGNPHAILCINTDTTEQKKLQTQFLRAQRMESIGTLAGGIAHDLNNVLSPILMASEILKLDFRETKDRELIDLITNCADRGANLVKQVLSFARGAEGTHTLINVRELLGGVVHISEDTFPKSISIRCSVEPNLPPVNGDPTQLHQVLLNLCVNARDAMPEGGTLSLAAKSVMVDKHYASMENDAKPGAYVLIDVDDTGHGISPENIEKIFDPFFTTKEIGKGTGLGLSTALGIVKGHHGFFRVSSKPGRGSKFSVYLPADTESRTEGWTSDEVAPPRGNGEWVLLVDDEDTIRESTRIMLEQHGYRVLLAASGTDGVATYATHKDKIAVVLTDLMMPDMDGISMARVLLKMNPDLPIIAASGLAETESGAKVAQAGIRHFLAKPYMTCTLLRILADELLKKRA